MILNFWPVALARVIPTKMSQEEKILFAGGGVALKDPEAGNGARDAPQDPEDGEEALEEVDDGALGDLGGLGGVGETLELEADAVGGGGEAHGSQVCIKSMASAAFMAFAVFGAM